MHNNDDDDFYDEGKYCRHSYEYKKSGVRVDLSILCTYYMLYNVCTSHDDYDCCEEREDCRHSCIYMKKWGKGQISEVICI